MKNGRQMGREAGAAAGWLERQTVEAAQYTVKQAEEFTSEFMNSFRKELKRKR